MQMRRIVWNIALMVNVFSVLVVGLAAVAFAGILFGGNTMASNTIAATATALLLAFAITLSAVATCFAVCVDRTTRD